MRLIQWLGVLAMSLTLRRNGFVVDAGSTRYELGRLVHSFVRPSELTVRRAIGYDDADAWCNEEQFELSDLSAGVLFSGVLRSSRRDYSAGRDDTSCRMAGLDGLADGIIFTLDGSARVVFNAHPDDAATGDYCEERCGLTAGQILATVLDEMCAPLAGIIGNGMPGGGYVGGELALLNVVPPKVTFRGCTVPECVALVMRYAPEFGVYVDPASRRLRVVDFRNLEGKTITVGSDAVVEAHLDFTTEGCYTACRVQGAAELIDREVELTPAWNALLEEDWTPDKAYQEPETYGRVWRRFACPDNNLAASRAVGKGPVILVVIDNGWQRLCMVLTDWADVDYAAGEIELPWLARQWSQSLDSWQTADVRMRYTYRYGPISARWPEEGFTGTAFTSRGLRREKVLVDNDAMRVTVEGRVDRVESEVSFRSFLLGLRPDELVGKAVSFDGGPAMFTVAANDRNMVELSFAPATPLAEGDTFCVIVQDDTERVFEGGELSKLELRAREWLRGRCDERYEGVVPLAGIDLSVRLGQSISFAGTQNPAYGSLNATLVEVVYDFARDRTELVLTGERSLGGRREWEDRYRRLLAEHDLRNLEDEVKLLRRAVGKRRGLLWDGDRDPRLAYDAREPLMSVGKYGEELVLRGDAKLEEDDDEVPSIEIERVAGHNSLKIGANFGGSSDVREVTLGQSEPGDSNLVADASHRHLLSTNFTLEDDGNDRLSHAVKEAFDGAAIVGPLTVVWDSVYGHMLDVTSGGT